MEPTPAAIFDAYEQDFTQIITSVKERLEAPGDGEQGKATLRKVERDLDDADDLVSALELEIQGIPQSIKPQYLPRLKRAKADLTQFKKLAKDVHAQQARTELLGRAGGRGSSDDPYGERSNRERLLSGTQILDDGLKRIEGSQRVALEAEDQGTGILRSLRAQRESIEGARNQLHTADTNLDRASGTIKKMVREMHKQRFFLIFIAVLIVLMIVWRLTYKLFR